MSVVWRRVGRACGLVVCRLRVWQRVCQVMLECVCARKCVGAKANSEIKAETQGMHTYRTHISHTHIAHRAHIFSHTHILGPRAAVPPKEFYIVQILGQ